MVGICNGRYTGNSDSVGDCKFPGHKSGTDEPGEELAKRMILLSGIGQSPLEFRI